MLYNHITELIGNTPLLRIDPATHGLKNIELYAKLEMMNPFGSVKDRVAWGMIKDNIADIQAKEQTILEMSSGNTAKALQVLASVFGVNFKTITNRIKVKEVKDILKVLGTEIMELPGTSDCHDPNDPNDPLIYIEKEIREKGEKVFHTDQYANPKNILAHYSATGEEIVHDLPQVDYFFGGLGTTGSTRGTSEKLKEYNPQLETIGIIATKQDYIPGIRNRDEIFEVGLFDSRLYKDFEYVSSQQAIEGMKQLIDGAGILCGPTSGATYVGTLEYLKKVDSTLTEKKNAVFIVCDRMEWYVSYIKERRPDLFGEKNDAPSFFQLKESEILEAPILGTDNLVDWIESNNPIIIDIRTHVAFEVGHIHSSFNIPEKSLFEILNHAQSFPFPKEKIILFVCPYGERSKAFSAYANKIGYVAYSLEGGVVGYRQRGLPLEKEI
jgi:cysteine synthase B